MLSSRHKPGLLQCAKNLIGIATRFPQVLSKSPRPRPRIERLWGLMHRNVTHNKCYATCAQFADATLGFLREKVPRNWADLCDSVTDNFRVISPNDFRVLR